jgi:hypothetical protein
MWCRLDPLYYLGFHHSGCEHGIFLILISDSYSVYTASLVDSLNYLVLNY